MGRVFGTKTSTACTKNQSVSNRIDIQHNTFYLVELFEMRKISHHATLAFLPGLLLLRAVDLDLCDADEVLQVVVPGLLAQALVLGCKRKETKCGK